jgi:multidrug efflux pump subunit AcrB
VTVAETRNYGETAREKASELIQHLGIATISVTLLIGFFLGWREAVVVLVAVPVTLALTLFRLLRAGLYAQPHHPVRADLFDRHPGR